MTYQVTREGKDHPGALDNAPIMDTIVPIMSTNTANVPGDPVAEALFGKTRRGVLALLFSRPDESFYLREVARVVGTGQGAVQRELQRLVRAGIARRMKRGPQVHFQANPACPIFTDLKRIMLKTAALADVLRASLSEVASRISLAFVYGSFASGTQTAASDVDLCVVGNLKFGDLVEVLYDSQSTLGREVNPTIYPPPEFRQKLADRHHFLTSIVDGPKIFLIGDERELSGLAGKRMGETPSDQSRDGSPSTTQHLHVCRKPPS